MLSCPQVIGVLARNKKYANSVKGLHGDGASKVLYFKFVQFFKLQNLGEMRGNVRQANVEEEE